MKVEGTYSFKATRERVWETLLDPAVLTSCIPGCEKFEQVADDAYDVVLRIGIAAITGTYSGKVTVLDKNYPESYRMVVEGSGSGGTVRGEGRLTLQARSGETDITVEGDAQVTGVIARVGQRLMGSVSRMLMNQFFACIKEKVEAA